MMDINMNVDKKELNTIFEVLLKNALANDVTLNLNIDLKECTTPVKTFKPVISTKHNTPTVTLGRCEECGTVQAVNYEGNKVPICYNCHGDLSTDLRNFEHDCTCGNHINVNIVGTGLAYVSCNDCDRRYSIKMDYEKDMWVVR